MNLVVASTSPTPTMSENRVLRHETGKQYRGRHLDVTVRLPWAVNRNAPDMLKAHLVTALPPGSMMKVSMVIGDDHLIRVFLREGAASEEVNNLIAAVGDYLRAMSKKRLRQFYNA